MAINNLLTPQWISGKSLMSLEANCPTIQSMDNSSNDQFGQPGMKIGDMMMKRKPQRFNTADGPAYQPEGLNDTGVPLVMNNWSQVAFDWNSQEMAQSLDEIDSRYITPAGIALGNKLEYRALNTAMLNTGQFVGTFGQTPGQSSTDAFQIWGAAAAKLQNNGFPMGKGQYTALLNPTQQLWWNAYSKAFFNSQDALGKQWKTGQISDALGLNWLVAQNVNIQTAGAFGGTPAVNGANQTGTSITINGCSNNITGWAKAGDIVSFPSIYRVFPQAPHQSTGVNFEAVLQADVNTDGSGNATLVLGEAIVPSGQYQNVTASPTNGDLIKVYNTAAAGQSALAGVASAQGIVMHKTAFAYMFIPLEEPRGVDMAKEMRSPQSGISVRFVRQYLGAPTDLWINRMDCVYGCSPQYPEGSVRVPAGTL